MDKKKLIIICSIIAAVAIACVGAFVLLTSVFSGDDGDKTSEPASTSQTGETTGGEIELTAGNVEGEQDAVVKVPITVSANPGFMISRTVVTFDNTVLEYMGCENGDVITDYYTDAGDNMIVVLHENAEDTDKNGTLLTLKFRVIGKSGSKSDISFVVGETAEAQQAQSKTEFVNFNELEIVPKATDGSVTVK